ncbi:hypothetical protein N9O57_00370 [bacterium]|nr:hypothetical protein [bacterium]
MKQFKYKKICEQACTLRRATLEETITLIDEKNQAISEKLKKILNSTPVSKPKNHKGDASSDFFKIDLTNEELEFVVEVIQDAEVSALGNNGETTPMASHYSELLNIWNAI